jgi:hypothetical protein
MKFSKIIVTLVILLNVVFTGAVLYVFLQTGNEPSVLIGSFFGFTTGEMWLLATVKKAKVKQLNQQSKSESEIEK